MKSAIVIVIIAFFSCNSLIHNSIEVGLISDIYPKTLDPASSDGYYDYIVYSSIYETLLKIDNDNKTLSPNLAVNWKVSENQKRIFLELRPEVFFHDNTKFSAYSVKESFAWTIKKNPSHSLLKMINSIEVIDSLSLYVHLKYVYTPFLFVLASPFGLNIYSEHALDKYGELISNHPVGTGPFFLKEINHEKISMHSFSKHRKKIHRELNVIFKSCQGEFGTEKALRDEIVDISFPVSGSIADRLMWSGAIDYQVLHTDNIVYLGFNLNQKFLIDLKIREGILKTIDVQKLVFGFQRGNSIVAKNSLPPGLLNCKSKKQDEFNLSEAKNLIKDTGFNNGIKINLFSCRSGSERYIIPEFLKSSLSKIGIEVKIINFESWPDFINAVHSDSCHIFIDSWTNDLFGDAENFLFSLFSNKSENNLLGYNNPKVEELLAKAVLEPDIEKREQMYCQIVQIILDDVPAVFLYHVKQHFAYNKKKIKYLPVDPYGVIQFHEIIFN